MDFQDSQDQDKAKLFQLNFKKATGGVSDEEESKRQEIKKKYLKIAIDKRMSPPVDNG
jgi:ribosomal protein L29